MELPALATLGLLPAPSEGTVLITAQHLASLIVLLIRSPGDIATECGI